MIAMGGGREARGSEKARSTEIGQREKKISAESPQVGLDALAAESIQLYQLALITVYEFCVGLDFQIAWNSFSALISCYGGGSCCDFMTSATVGALAVTMTSATVGTLAGLLLRLLLWPAFCDGEDSCFGSDFCYGGHS